MTKKYCWLRRTQGAPVSGFTLLELLIAIAIFAVLSALGWKIFDYLIKVKDQNTQHEQNLFALQDAYQQMLRDTLQVVPLNANIGGQLRAAFYLNNQILQMSKAGVADPLNEGISPYERVEYRYDASQKIVYRLKYSGLNLPSQVQPQSSVYLNNVDQFNITVLNPEPLQQWAGTNDLNLSENENLRQLPKGLKINVTISGIDYEWIFRLPNSQAIFARTK